MTRARRSSSFGVDIGGTKILAVALSETDEVLTEARTATPRDALDPGDLSAREIGVEVADAVAQVVEELADEVGAPRAVGVGVPGMLDGRGVLRFAPNLPGAAGADLRSLLRAQRLGASVVVENDANCAAVSEHRLGAAKDVQDFLMVTLGTGIGGAFFSGGRLRVGANRFAGEIGHMVVDPSGPPCPCGGRGCWERFASGAGLGRLAREAAHAGRLHVVLEAAGGDPELVRAEHVTAAARDGDPGALAVLEELSWWVALGLANLTAISDPGRIVVGGGLVEIGELLLEPARRAYGGLVEGGSARPPLDLVPAAFGERAGAVGAALLARVRASGGAR